MMPVRTVPLYDPKAKPASWHERMKDGEYAVHYSSFPAGAGIIAPYCAIFSSMQDARTHASEWVAENPGIRCTIYDWQGFVGAPLKEVRGVHFKDRGEISSRFRRWVGGTVFVAGGLLVLVDWAADFRLLWPSTLGMRLFLPGLILVVTEVAVTYHARRQKLEDA
jgi:hypothetical protein